jgi:hypothetical protein
MTSNICAPWLDCLDPVDQIAELRARLQDATDQFVANELEVRAAVRRRNRALSLMRDIRHTMVQLSARHGLLLDDMRFGPLLDELDAAE